MADPKTEKRNRDEVVRVMRAVLKDQGLDETDVMPIIGYLEGDPTGKRRHHLRVTRDANEYLSISRDDVVKIFPASEAGDPPLLSLMWVKRNAVVRRFRRDDDILQAKFLTGDITDGNLTGSVFSFRHSPTEGDGLEDADTPGCGTAAPCCPSPLGPITFTCIPNCVKI
jgi:hypothetical protein